MNGEVAIAGASVRAAVFSALRAGLVPVGMDLFADADLVRRAQALRVEQYPEGLDAAVVEHKVDGWLYTGGIENHPDLVDRIAQSRTLWGNPGPTLRAVRDPFAWTAAIEAEGLPCPPIAHNPAGLPRDGSWLRKPLDSSGGAGIGPWTGRDDAGQAVRCYFQKRIAGVPCSAVFVGAQGRAVLLGATWQLVGTEWTGARGFAYAGSIGPIEPRSEVDSQWQRIADVVASRFGLVGLFGVDGVFDGRIVWPVEVNPRYCASTEVLERSLGIEALGAHVEACRFGRLPERPDRTDRPWCGKAVLYASSDTTVSPEFTAFAEKEMERWPWPDLADVPEPGAAIRRGAPVTTVLAQASDEPSLRQRLRLRVERVQTLLGMLPRQGSSLI